MASWPLLKFGKVQTSDLVKLAVHDSIVHTTTTVNYAKFEWRNRMESTVSGFRFARLSDTVLPAALKEHSLAALEAELPRAGELANLVEAVRLSEVATILKSRQSQGL